jgi:uncharacterized protein YjiS (DUF1127 family)
MEASSIAARRIQTPAAAALVIVLAELFVAAYRVAARVAAAVAASQRRARARSELLALSDRSLRDIGLSRSDVHRLFG